MTKRGQEYRGLTSKQIAVELVQRPSDEGSLDEIAREIEFIAGIEQGLAEFDRGETLSSEQLGSEVMQCGTTYSAK